MGKYTEWATRLRDQMETAAAVVDDAVGSKCVDLFPAMKYDGSLIKAGTRINWEGKLKRAAVDLWASVDNDPANAPGLWEDVAYHNGYRIIPETITATLAFSAGEVGYWEADGGYYEAINNGTVYNPAVMPSLWKAVVFD